MKVMDSLSVFMDSYESVLQAYKDLEAYYETIRDSKKLSAVLKELDANKEDFTQVEQILKGYLSSTSKSLA